MLQVVINVLSCLGAAPLLLTIAEHGCAVGGANACPAGKGRTPLSISFA